VDGGKVHGLVGLALAGGPVPEIGDGYRIFAHHFACQRVPHGLGQPGSDDVGNLDDVPRQVGSLQRELASARVWLALLAHEGEHHLARREPGGHLDRQVPVVREKETITVFLRGQQRTQFRSFVPLA